MYVKCSTPLEKSNESSKVEDLQLGERVGKNFVSDNSKMFDVFVFFGKYIGKVCLAINMFDGDNVVLDRFNNCIFMYMKVSIFLDVLLWLHLMAATLLLYMVVGCVSKSSVRWGSLMMFWRKRSDFTHSSVA